MVFPDHFENAAVTGEAPDHRGQRQAAERRRRVADSLVDPSPRQFKSSDFFRRRVADDMARHLGVGGALKRRQRAAVVFVKRRHSNNRASEALFHNNFCHLVISFLRVSPIRIATSFASRPPPYAQRSFGR
jgi:hypothetical protein